MAEEEAAEAEESGRKVEVAAPKIVDKMADMKGGINNLLSLYIFTQSIFFNLTICNYTFRSEGVQESGTEICNRR